MQATQSSFKDRAWMLLFFAASLSFFLLSLYNQFIIKADCRYALFAISMWHHGLSWFPIEYGQPYPDYTVTQTILSWLTVHLFGKISVMSVMLPNAIITAIAVVQTYQLAKLHNSDWAKFSAVLLLLTSVFYTHGFSLGGDQYVVATALFSFYFAYTKRFWWVPLGLIGGFLFRGPIGFIISATPVFCLYFFSKEYKKTIGFGVLSVFLLGVCIAGLLGAAYLQGGMAFVKHVWSMEYASRTRVDTTSSFIHLDAWHKYTVHFVTRFCLALPICFLVLCGLGKKLVNKTKSPEIKLISICLAWILVTFIGMGIPGARKVHYILAICPPIAIIAGYLYIAEKNRFFTGLKFVIRWFGLLSPVLMLGLIAGVEIYKNQHGFKYDLNLIGLSIGFGIISIASLFAFLAKPGMNRNFYSLIILLLTYVVINSGIVVPIVNQTRDSLKFIHAVQAQQKPNEPIVFYKILGDSHGVNFMANVKPYFKPQFVTTPAELKNYKKPAVFITFENQFKKHPIDLPITIIAHGRLGRINAEAFRITK